MITFPRHIRPVGIEADDARMMRREIAGKLLLCEQHRHRGIGEHEGAAFLRVIGIDRHIRAARLENAEETNYQFERTLDADAHEHAGTDAQPAQPVGKLVCAAVEFTMRELRAVKFHGNGIRSALRLRGDERVQRRRARKVRRSLIPFVQHAVPFRWRKDRDFEDALLRRAHDLAEEVREIPRQPLDRLLGKQLGAELDLPEKSAAVLLEKMQREIHLRGVQLEIKAAHAQIPEARTHRREHLHQHLENRVAARITGRLQAFHYALKRHVRIGESREKGLPAALQECDEIRVARRVASQRHHIQEISNQPFKFGKRAVCKRSADQDLLLARVTHQQHVQCSPCDGEERASLLAGHRCESLRQPGWNREAHMGSPEGLPRRARMIGREFEHRQFTLQLPQPVIRLPCVVRARRLGFLPFRKVGILRPEHRKRRGCSGYRGAIMGIQLVEHQTE